MNSGFLIREFHQSEWMYYKELRLGSLLESPDAYGGTHAQEVERSDEQWKLRFLAGVQSDNDLALAARSTTATPEGTFIGLAWCKRNSEIKHSAHIYQMWVRPEYRGKGVGLALLSNIKEWAQQNMVRTLYLGVTANNDRACRLYTKFGFEADGELEPLRPGSVLMVQPMKLNLSQD